MDGKQHKLAAFDDPRCYGLAIFTPAPDGTVHVLASITGPQDIDKTMDQLEARRLYLQLRRKGWTVPTSFDFGPDRIRAG